MPEGSVRSFYAEITGSSEGLVRAAGEGEAAAGSLEKRIGGVNTSLAGVGASSRTHLGGTGVEQASLLERGMNSLDTRVKDVVGSIASAGAQFATFGAIGGVGAFLIDGVKNAEAYNAALAKMRQAEQDAGVAIPQAQIDAEVSSLMKLGVNATNTVDALTQMTAAHVPLAEQMDTLQAAEDLAASKGLDLNSSLALVERAAEGQGRALAPLGLILPATVPKMAALDSAQKAYNDSLAKYGEQSPKTQAAFEKLQKITAEMHSPFENLSQVTGELENRLGGAAQSAANADPWIKLKAEFQDVSIKAGEMLLPKLDELAGWFESHQTQIEHGMSSAFHAVSDAVGIVGTVVGTVAPPVEHFIGFLGDHKQAVKDVAEGVAALYAADKTKSVFSTLTSDLQGFLNLTGKVTRLGGAGSIAPMHVWVDNPGFGAAGGAGGVAGGANSAEEGAAGGTAGGALSRVIGMSGGTAATIGALGIMNTSDADLTAKSYQDMLTTEQAQAKEADAAVKSADVSRQVATLWSQRKDVMNADTLQADVYLSQVMSNSGTQAQLSATIADLYQRHQIQSAVDLQAVIDAWNRGVTSSRSIAALLDTTRASSGLAALHGQNFSDLIGYLASQSRVSSNEIISDYMQTAAFAASMQRHQQDIDNMLANLANTVPSSIYDTHTGGGRGYVGGLATGGLVAAAATGGFQSGLRLVGEHGPELDVFGPGDDLKPNFGHLGFGQMGSLGGSGGDGGDTYITITGPINVQGVDDPAAFFEAVQKEALRRGANQGQRIFGRYT